MYLFRHLNCLPTEVKEAFIRYSRIYLHLSCVSLVSIVLRLLMFFISNKKGQFWLETGRRKHPREPHRGFFVSPEYRLSHLPILKVFLCLLKIFKAPLTFLRFFDVKKTQNDLGCFLQEKKPLPGNCDNTRRASRHSSVN